MSSKNDDNNVTEELKVLRSELLQLRSIMKTAPIGIGLVIDRKFEFVNQIFLEMVGFTEKELVGKNSRIVYPNDEEYDRVGKYKYEQIKDKGSGSIETRLRGKDGSIIDVLLSSTLLDPDNLSLGVTFTVLDITKRKLAEEKLKKNEQFLDHIFESIQDGISVLNPDLSIRHVNSVMNNWYSDKLPLEGKKCFHCYHNGSEPCDPCPTLRSIESGTTEFNMVPGKPGSDIKWLELLSYPMKDSKTGKITGVVEFVRNVTDRIEAEEELSKERTLLNTLLYSTPDKIFFKDKDNRFVRVNIAKADEQGTTPEEMIGKTDLDYYPEKIAKITCEDDEKILKTGQIIKNKEEKIRLADGSFKWVSVTKLPRKADDGSIIGTMGIARASPSASGRRRRCR